MNLRSYISILLQVTDFSSLQTCFRSRNFFENYGLERIGVFGLLARGESFNDVDLMIEDAVTFQTLVKLQS